MTVTIAQAESIRADERQRIINMIQLAILTSETFIANEAPKTSRDYLGLMSPEVMRAVIVVGAYKQVVKTIESL